MSRAEQAFAFCSALLGGRDGDDRLSDLYTTVWSSADKLTRWRRADQPGAVASLITSLDEKPGARAVYVGVGLASQVKHRETRFTDDDGTVVTDQRPAREDIDGLLGLWADIDIAGDGHSDAHYPETVETARRIVDALRLKPTLVVHSGGGLQVWWMFTEPWLVADADDPAAERAKMAKLAQDWTRTVQYQAELIGRYKVDSVFDLARLLRPAGTTNRKIDGDPRRVQILEHNEGATYDWFDFEDHLADPSVIAAYSASAGSTLTGVALSEAEAAILREVNLGAVWARVNSPAYRALDYTPLWLADILELEAEVDEPKITKVWTGDRPEFKGDQNRFDAALVRLLAAFDAVDTEGLVEALMCRRLRLVDGTKAEKVDPRRRLDYVARTVARFRAEAAKDEQLKIKTDATVDAFASVTLSVPARPAPALAEVKVDHRGRVADQEEAEQAFLDFADELVEEHPPTPGEQARAADDVVVAEHTGAAPVHSPDEPDDDPFAMYEDRSVREIEALDTLSELLLPKPYRERGIGVLAIEYRDYGDKQQGRMLLRIPLDFDWPTDRPSRYRPGRPLPTEWWPRTLFDSPKGFRQSVERDCKIITREDASKKDWAALIRTLIPLWRRDSSGSDIGNVAHEWLYSYLMLHHGTGQTNEVGASGRPWVRHTNGWTPDKPPVIYIDQNQFLEHCKNQPGGVQGRAARTVLEFLRITRRRPRVQMPGSIRRPTWYEVEQDQFSRSEWQSIIEVTRPSYERSMTGKHMRVVGDERGVSIGDGGRAAR